MRPPAQACAAAHAALRHSPGADRPAADAVLAARPSDARRTGDDVRPRRAPRDGSHHPDAQPEAAGGRRARRDGCRPRRARAGREPLGPGPDGLARRTRALASCAGRGEPGARASSRLSHCTASSTARSRRSGIERAAAPRQGNAHDPEPPRPDPLRRRGDLRVHLRHPHGDRALRRADQHADRHGARRDQLRVRRRATRVGPRPADRRRDRRPLWRGPRDRGRDPDGRSGHRADSVRGDDRRTCLRDRRAQSPRARGPPASRSSSARSRACCRSRNVRWRAAS